MGIVGGLRNSLSGNFSAIMSGRDNTIGGAIGYAGEPHHFGFIGTGKGNVATKLYTGFVTGEESYSQGYCNAIITGLRNQTSQFTSNGSVVLPQFCLIGTGDTNRAKHMFSAVLTGSNVRAQGHTIAAGSGYNASYTGVGNWFNFFTDNK